MSYTLSLISALEQHLYWRKKLMSSVCDARLVKNLTFLKLSTYN